jgi:hypothetical protein
MAVLSFVVGYVRLVEPPICEHLGWQMKPVLFDEAEMGHEVDHGPANFL